MHNFSVENTSDMLYFSKRIFYLLILMNGGDKLTKDKTSSVSFGDDDDLVKTSCSTFTACLPCLVYLSAGLSS